MNLLKKQKQNAKIFAHFAKKKLILFWKNHFSAQLNWNQNVSNILLKQQISISNLMIHVHALLFFIVICVHNQIGKHGETINILTILWYA